MTEPRRSGVLVVLVLRRELCLDEFLRPVSVDENLCVGEALEANGCSLGVVDGVVTVSDATDGDCLVADCVVHFVSFRCLV